eukprot:364520-Chlamydomonas_euryale.AAC.9
MICLAFHQHSEISGMVYPPVAALTFPGRLKITLLLESLNHCTNRRLTGRRRVVLDRHRHLRAARRAEALPYGQVGGQCAGPVWLNPLCRYPAARMDQGDAVGRPQAGKSKRYSNTSCADNGSATLELDALPAKNVWGNKEISQADCVLAACGHCSVQLLDHQTENSSTFSD